MSKLEKRRRDNVNVEDVQFRNMFNRIHRLNEELETATSTNNNGGEVKIPQNDPYFIELKNNLIKFVGQVNTDENSLIVYPSDNDVVFNGVIVGMNNLKFQYRYNDQSGGLYIWGDSVLLTKDAADKLGKLVILKEQWEDYWSENIDNYKKQ